MPPIEKPTYADVILARKSLAALRLPAEIVLIILDYAEYWIEHVHASTFSGTPIAKALHLPNAILAAQVDPYTTKTVHKLREAGEIPRVRSIEWVLTGRDQGWTSENTHGTYNTSSWWEASIVRGLRGCDPVISAIEMQRSLPTPKFFHHCLPAGCELVRRPVSAKQGPQDGEGEHAWYIQGNRVAAGSDTYRVRWTEGESWGNEGKGTGERFIESLQEGDYILVWGRAKVCFIL